MPIIDYEAFVEKFKDKKTTDDCYTPRPVYSALLGWVTQKFSLTGADETQYNEAEHWLPYDGGRIVRPFYPRGDYARYPYQEGDVVIDNPPFSIMAEIIRCYEKSGIRYWLFAPALTLFECLRQGDNVTAVVMGAQLVYENGAKVPTSFVTNLYPTPSPWVVIEPELRPMLLEANKQTIVERRSISLPIEMLSAALLQKVAKRDIPFRVERRDGRFQASLDCGQQIFGGGLLLSKEAAAERAAAERAAAERAAAATYHLSEREKRLSERMRKLEQVRAKEGDLFGMFNSKN